MMGEIIVYSSKFSPNRVSVGIVRQEELRQHEFCQISNNACNSGQSCPVYVAAIEEV